MTESVPANSIRLPFSRPLLLLCAGILLATMVAAILCQNIIVDNLNSRGNQYGQALANLAGRQAIDATLNHDLVSLQVILSDIAENADVALATIHDVENNLLVQAGKPRTRRDADLLRSYTAPITLHRSIAGYVTVTIDFTNTQQVARQVYWLFGFMAALLIALALSALYFGRSWNTPLTITRPTIPIVDSPPKPEPAVVLPLEAVESLGRALPNIELVIQLHNLRELQGQLNSQAFRGLSQRLENNLRGVLALYAGQILQLSSDQIRIAFHDDEDGSGAFHGLCSAWLLRSLNQNAKGIQLRQSLLLRKRASDSTMLRNLPFELQDSDELNQILSTAQDGALLVDAQAIDSDQLAQRIETETTDYTDLLLLEGFLEPYQSLLSKQLTQLQRQ